MANSSSRLVWSKSTRIKVMIAIDTAFFLLELICGFLAHSLALTADAFHMLNDIISLAIGLWAVIASQKATTDEFTFGWVRAEILGAFFNAVFLIALCVSIILEALTRFVEPPEINNPKLILIVGCAGLFSNLLGFVVLGGHGHDHGDDHDHDHDHDHEEGHAHGHAHGHDHSHSHAHGQRDGTSSIADEYGPVGDVLPEVIVRRASMVGGRASMVGGRASTESPETARRIHFGDESTNRDESNTRASRTSHSRGRDHQRQSTKGHSRFSSIEDMSIHPASFRQEILAVSRAASSTVCANGSGDESPGSDAENGPNETSPLLQDTKGSRLSYTRRSTSKNSRSRRDSSVHIHNDHHHTLPIKPGSKVSGHNHADMGMHAMMLHVIGDALGNVGVIVTALIIWLTNWPGKLYADPAVSLLITAIILKTSIPLTLATSRVLLQATPENISISHIRQDIERLPGVVSCHHIHVWQLSDTKIIASMHLQVSFPFDKNSGEKYMQLAKRARRCLHAYGIHSATIQPEFCLDNKHQHDGDAAALALDGASDEQLRPCLLECVDDCQAEGCCIVETSSACSSRRDSASSHEEHQHEH